MELTMLYELLRCYVGKTEDTFSMVTAQRTLRERGLIEYSFKSGWVPSNLGKRVLESAGYLVERTAHRGDVE